VTKCASLQSHNHNSARDRKIKLKYHNVHRGNSDCCLFKLSLGCPLPNKCHVIEKLITKFYTECCTTYWPNFGSMFYTSFRVTNVQYPMGQFDTLTELNASGASCNCCNLTKFLLVHCLCKCGCVVCCSVVIIKMPNMFTNE
jgi:hypothetical protein